MNTYTPIKIDHRKRSLGPAGERKSFEPMAAIAPQQMFVLNRGRVSVPGSKSHERLACMDQRQILIAIFFHDLIRHKDKNPSFSAKQTRTKDEVAPI
jgi:hypothetical protein